MAIMKCIPNVNKERAQLYEESAINEGLNMSNPEISTPFSYTSRNLSPKLSPCGNYIAYIQSNKLVIKKSKNLRNVIMHSISVPMDAANNTQSQFIRISSIVWDHPHKDRCQKLAVVLDNLDMIQIFHIREDGAPIIIQESWEGIEKVEWIPASSNSVDSAYRGSKQLVVFSKDNLKCSLYSLDSSVVLAEIFKPKLNRVFTKRNSDVWILVTRETTKDQLWVFHNRDSTSKLIRKVNLTGQLDVNHIEWSLSGKWLFINDTTLGCKISFWNLLGISSERNKPIQDLEIQESLGLNRFEWTKIGDDEVLFMTDYDNNLYSYNMNKLKIDNMIKLSTAITSLSTVWKQNFDSNSKFFSFRKQTLPFNIPEVATPQVLNTVNHMKSNSSHDQLALNRNVALETVLIHNSSLQLTDVIISISKVISFEWHDFLTNMLLIVNEFNLILYCGDWTVPIIINPDFRIKDAHLMYDKKNKNNGIISILCLSSNSFVKISYKLSSDRFNMLNIGIDDREPSPLEPPNDQEVVAVEQEREGSPILLEDEDSHVVEIIHGVQQREWGLKRNLDVTDTFQNKRIKEESVD